MLKSGSLWQELYPRIHKLTEKVKTVSSISLRDAILIKSYFNA